MALNFNEKIFHRNIVPKDDNVYRNFSTEEMILRDHLAVDRTILSNEATFLAYIRTSLAVLVGSATIFHFFNNFYAKIIGLLLALMGIFVFILGCVSSFKIKRKIDMLKNRNRHT